MHELWRLAPAAHAGLRAASFRAYPEEACGALVGRAPDRRITAVHALRNVHEGPRTTHFRIDPMALVALEDGLDPPETVVGVFHSHPHRPAMPSPADCANAWPGLLEVIQEVRGPGSQGAVRAYRFDEALRPRTVSLRLEG